MLTQYQKYLQSEISRFIDSQKQGRSGGGYSFVFKKFMQKKSRTLNLHKELV